MLSVPTIVSRGEDAEVVILHSSRCNLCFSRESV